MKRNYSQFNSESNPAPKQFIENTLKFKEEEYIIKKKKSTSASKNKNKSKDKDKDKSEDAVKWKTSEFVSHQIGNSNLPIFFKREEILDSINRNQVSIISGNTGCGKSTQLPLFLYEDALKKGNEFKIICTQPRRLACVNIARRVKEEILSFYAKSNIRKPSEYLKHIVGYHIGMEANYKSFSKIIFATNGIFLNYLVHNPEVLKEYTHVVLDEVHERDLDMDFILILLRCLASEFPRLKIILMSATLDSTALATYYSPERLSSKYIFKFQSEVETEINLRNTTKFEKENKDLLKNDFGRLAWKVEGTTLGKDPVKAQEFKDEWKDMDSLDESKIKQNQIHWWNDEILEVVKSQTTFEFDFTMKKSENNHIIQGSESLAVQININVTPKYKVDIFFLDTLDQFSSFKYRSQTPANEINVLKKKGLFIDEFVQLAMDLIRFILTRGQAIPCTKATSKFLVFLPGLAEIFYFMEQLELTLESISYGKDEYEIIALHSDLSKDFDLRKINDQKRCFILATNIAESSITIPDIAFVIDFCLAKELFVRKNQISCLELVWSSRASCLQRKGRTGRVNNGYCFYMLPKKFFYECLNVHSTPEMSRIPLDKIILKCNLIKSLLKEFRLRLLARHAPAMVPLIKEDEGHAAANHEQRVVRVDRLLQIFKNPHFILRLALDVPAENKIEDSIRYLKEVSAIKFNSQSNEFDNTFLGKLYCDLPLPVSSIKLIIYGKIFGCLEESINITTLLNHSKGIMKLSKHMPQNEINRLFSLYQRMDEQQYSDIIILNNLYKEFEIDFARELQNIKQRKGPKSRMVRSFFARQKDKDYFSSRFLDVKSLIDVFQQKNDIIRKLINLQRKNSDFVFLDFKEMAKFQDFIGRSSSKQEASKKHSFGKPIAFDFEKEDFYERLKITITAAFMPRIALGFPNTNWEKKKDRQFVDNVLKMDTDNLIIVRNSRIPLLFQDVTDRLPRSEKGLIGNILKSLYLSKVICSLEERIGKIRRFEMQELEVYVEFEPESARAAIERLLFIQNYFAKDKQTVKLFSLQGGEYNERVEKSSHNPREEWNIAEMLHRVKGIVLKQEAGFKSAPSRETSRSRDKSLHHDEHLIYLTTKLFEGLEKKDHLVRQIGRAVLRDLSSIIENFCSFHYLNELSFEDNLDHNETIFEHVSVNKNLKADRGVKQLTMITSGLRENSMKKYFARGVTRLPMYNSIFEIYTLIFEKNSHLIISADWVKNFDLDLADHLKDSGGNPALRGFQIVIKKIESVAPKAVSEGKQELGPTLKERTIELKIKWLEELVNFSGLDWSKMKFFYNQIAESDLRSTNLTLDLLIHELDALLEISSLTAKEYNLQPKEEAKPVQKEEHKSSQFSNKLSLKSEEGYSFALTPFYPEVMNAESSPRKIPYLIHELVHLEESGKTINGKIMSDSGNKQGSQSIFCKGLVHNMKYLFSEDDIKKIVSLNQFVNSNLEHFNLFADWECLIAEFQDLLRRPRVPNFFKDRWVRSFVKLQRKKRYKNVRVKKESMQNQRVDTKVSDLVDDLGLHDDEDFEVSQCPINPHSNFGFWNFWSVHYSNDIDLSTREIPKLNFQAYIKWKKKHLRDMTSLQKMASIYSSRVVCGVCKSRIIDVLDTEPVPGFDFCLKIKNHFRLFSKVIKSPKEIEEVRAAHELEIQMIETMVMVERGVRHKLKIEDFHVCPGRHLVAVKFTFSDDVFLPNNAKLRIIYPDHSYGEFQTQKFSYFQIKQKELKTKKSKLSKLKKFVCHVCEHENPAFNTTVKFVKHTGSKKHVENLTEFREMLDILDRNN